MKPLFGGRPAGPRMHGDHGGITDSDDEGTYLMQPQQQGVAQHTVFMGAPTAHVSDVELLGGASEVYVAGKDTPPAAPQVHWMGWGHKPGRDVLSYVMYILSLALHNTGRQTEGVYQPYKEQQ